LDAAFDTRHAEVTAVDRFPLYPMYHPGYVIRGAYPVRTFARDFARLAALLT
jgi:uracil-DNA glycosylase